MKITIMLLKKSLINLKMLIVVILSFSVLFTALVISGYVLNPDLGGIQTGIDLLSTYTVPFAMSSFVVFAGVFPGIPYAYNYLEERNCGYLKFILIRTSRKKYAFQKIFFSGLSGGVSMLIPGIMIFILLDIISLDTTPTDHNAIFEQTMWFPYMYIWGGRLVLVFKAILMFLFGVMWSELALMMSLIFRNKYVAFVLPFLIYELCGILVKVNEINPTFLIRSDYNLSTPIMQPYLIDILYILILCVINWYLFKRQEKK